MPDIRVYEVFDADNTPLGLAYFDYWKRDNKAGGAFMHGVSSRATPRDVRLSSTPIRSTTARFVRVEPPMDSA